MRSGQGCRVYGSTDWRSNNVISKHILSVYIRIRFILLSDDPIDKYRCVDRGDVDMYLKSRSKREEAYLGEFVVKWMDHAHTRVEGSSTIGVHIRNQSIVEQEGLLHELEVWEIPKVSEAITV